MKIVVLDGYTLNPGDLSWDSLQALGECAIYERTPAPQVVERCRGAEAVLTNKVVFSAEVLDQLPELRYIGVTATGYNVVALEEVRRRGITVTNVPGYSTASVAQMVFALVLELTQQVGHHDHLVRQGRWSASPDFCFWDRSLTELDGRTMGIVGYGQIGRAVSRIAGAFGMRVLVHTAHPEKYGESEEVTFVELPELFARADVISLHCPLTPQTEGLVDETRLATMKKTALLINTGRGPLVDEAALAAALNSGRIAGAGLDVLGSEPPSPDNPLLTAKNCFITPHIAWATQEARQRLLDITVANLAAYQRGEAANVVS
ncbi:D-2-hydroxyacid dehydrogenase [Desulfuromonas sp. AOP6]|uniref:D-2-hydroxyacid dehydrogenase n=1 Tax=Desulfuromonas sp. AOP6 TaxID=1566351 RepID=UPI00127DCC6C|nr:D-2-hydroxyacid dehydrogenase [Desulfuromonas sp. AOP6]BCA78898.1 glycerate dehydrogenase [Desulfuromonas sp. AOP6]